MSRTSKLPCSSAAKTGNATSTTTVHASATATATTPHFPKSHTQSRTLPGSKTTSKYALLDASIFIASAVSDSQKLARAHDQNRPPWNLANKA